MWRHRRSNGFVLLEAIISVTVVAGMVLLLSLLATMMRQDEARQRCRLDSAQEALMLLREKDSEEAEEGESFATGQLHDAIEWQCPGYQEVIHLETVENQTVRFSSH